MKFLSRILVLGGYILVYAGIANHGRFATSPWMGVFRDAYGVDSKTSTGAATTTAPVPSNGIQRRPGVRVGTRTAPETGAGGGTGAVNPKTGQPVQAAPGGTGA